MKLSQLYESVHDHDHFFLLQKIAEQLGYQRLKLHDSSYYFSDDDEDGKKYHYDASADIDVAIEIMRLPLEEKASAWNSLQRLQNLRSMDVDDMRAPAHAMEGPLKRLRGIEELAKAYQSVEACQDWVSTGAQNVLQVLMLLNGIKTWAKKGGEPESEERFKSSLAKATLRKLNIPLEGE